MIQILESELPLFCNKWILKFVSNTKQVDGRAGKSTYENIALYSIEKVELETRSSAHLLSTAHPTSHRFVNTRPEKSICAYHGKTTLYAFPYLTFAATDYHNLRGLSQDFVMFVAEHAVSIKKNDFGLHQSI